MKTPVLPFSTQLLFLSLPSPPQPACIYPLWQCGRLPPPSLPRRRGEESPNFWKERREIRSPNTHANIFLEAAPTARSQPMAPGTQWRHAREGEIWVFFSFSPLTPRAHEMPKPDWPSRRKGRSACSPARRKEVAYEEMERGEEGELILRSFQV